MVPTKTRKKRLRHSSIAAAVLVVLLVDGVTVYVRHHDATPVTVHDAIQKYRSDTHHTPTPAPKPTHTHPALNPPNPIPTATSPFPPVATATATATANPPASPKPGHTASSSPKPTATASPTASASPTPLTLPPAGVYSYATTGREQIGAPGGHRTYPATTAITVEKSGCGVTEEWDPNSEHSEARQLCLQHGKVRLASFSTKVAFFGVGSTEKYICGHDAVVYSPKMTLGQSTTFQCASSDSTAVQTVTPIGYRRLTVGGTSVRTLHVTVASALSGASEGTSKQQLWLTTDHSVLVRNTGRIDATEHNVEYHEQYVLDLKSLSPAQ